MGKWGNCDFKELEKMKKQIEAIEEGRDEFNRECAKELAARLLRKVVQRTPVGKAPRLDGPKTVKVKGAGGKSRSFLSKNGAILSKYWAGYVGGNLRRSWTVGEIEKHGEIYKIEIINPTEYASYVEYGHRQKPGRYVPAIGKRLKAGWVKGHFMMTISEKEIQAMVPAWIKKKLEAYLGRCMDAE